MLITKLLPVQVAKKYDNINVINVFKTKQCSQLFGESISVNNEDFVLMLVKIVWFVVEHDLCSFNKCIIFHFFNGAYL